MMPPSYLINTGIYFCLYKKTTFEKKRLIKNLIYFRSNAGVNKDADKCANPRASTDFYYPS